MFSINACLYRVVCAALLAGLVGGCAGGPSVPDLPPPWERPLPKLSAAQDKALAQFHKAALADGQFDYYTGDGWGKRFTEMPISNMAGDDLMRLLVGNYRVSHLPADKEYPDTWIINYYEPNGDMYECAFNVKGDLAYYRYPYYKHRSFVGYDSVVYGKGPRWHWGFFLFYVPRTGMIYNGKYYNQNGNNRKGTKYWDGYVGWSQRDRPAGLDRQCPQFPYPQTADGHVNERQTSDSYSDLYAMRNEAMVVRGLPVKFEQDPDDPVTAGMYFAHYGPQFFAARDKYQAELKKAKMAKAGTATKGVQ